MAQLSLSSRPASQAASLSTASSIATSAASAGAAPSPASPESSAARHVLFVCTTCNGTWEKGQRVGVSGGERLYGQLKEAVAASPIADRIEVQPVSCMSACSHHCAVAFAGPGKANYLFGGVDATAGEALEGAIAAVLTCAERYCDRADGQLPWAERPEPLKGGLLAKIPPLEPAAIARSA